VYEVRLHRRTRDSPSEADDVADPVVSRSG
jgi:hypothetical protein